MKDQDNWVRTEEASKIWGVSLKDIYVMKSNDKKDPDHKKKHRFKNNSKNHLFVNLRYRYPYSMLEEWEREEIRALYYRATEKFNDDYNLAKEIAPRLIKKPQIKDNRRIYMQLRSFIFMSRKKSIPIKKALLEICKEFKL